MTSWPDEVEKLRALLELRNEVDSLLEECLRDRLTLEASLARILPALAGATGAQGVWVHTFDEELSERRTFCFPEELMISGFAEVLERTSDKTRSTVALSRQDGLIIAQPLDVAGRWFGSAGLIVKESSPESTIQLQALL